MMALPVTLGWNRTAHWGTGFKRTQVWVTEILRGSSYVYLPRSDPLKPHRPHLAATLSSRSAEEWAAVHEAWTNGSFAWLVHVFAKSVSCYKVLSFISDEQVFGKKRDITPSAGMRGNLLPECWFRSCGWSSGNLLEYFSEVLCSQMKQENLLSSESCAYKWCWAAGSVSWKRLVIWLTGQVWGRIEFWVLSALCHCYPAN